ncbi:uncharacterized protein DDB_G0287625-like [Oppia nitens]|uniref:uncharacterized protein DDB_G0287625-like n=1 Tax=Oppia nitens TaxID=1686743 RepID=UPI0023DAC1C4|nr:uncharacterized protein DDB_G0287625-like [Oppia nitens]XP_054160044.1 uncharacterized protein DDB_G0287625-like [Oppia nitens]
MSNTSGNHLKVEDIYAIGEHRSRCRSSYKDAIIYTNRVMTNFADAVKGMNDAVLLPSKLKDIELTETEATTVTESLDIDIASKTDLFQYYVLLNNIKDDLFNGSTNSTDDHQFMINSNNNNYSFTTNNNNHNNNHNNSNGNYSSSSSSSTPNNNNNNRWDRQQSDDAFQSLSSLSSLSALSLDGDPVTFEDRANQLMSVFMQHLQSLYGILQQFSKVADYITKRYQQEIDSTDNK